MDLYNNTLQAKRYTDKTTKKRKNQYRDNQPSPRTDEVLCSDLVRLILACVSL